MPYNMAHYFWFDPRFQIISTCLSRVNNTFQIKKLELFNTENDTFKAYHFYIPPLHSFKYVGPTYYSNPSIFSPHLFSPSLFHVSDFLLRPKLSFQIIFPEHSFSRLYFPKIFLQHLVASVFFLYEIMFLFSL